MGKRRPFKGGVPEQPYVLGEGWTLRKWSGAQTWGGKVKNRWMQKAKGLGQHMTARHNSTCPYCSQNITTGSLISKAEFPNGDTAWVHQDCTQD
jgi:hypothetical protein